jgi:hypothetical protein
MASKPRTPDPGTIVRTIDENRRYEIRYPDNGPVICSSLDYHCVDCAVEEDLEFDQLPPYVITAIPVPDLDPNPALAAATPGIDVENTVLTVPVSRQVESIIVGAIDRFRPAIAAETLRHGVDLNNIVAPTYSRVVTSDDLATITKGANQ